VRRIIRKSAKDVAVMVGLFVIASAVGLYILQNQRLRIPVLEETPFELKAEFTTAQAVVPGQGQTVRVAGVRVGDIKSTELREGRAVITFELDREFDDLVRTNAKALLRPKTGLKDMFVELDPGTPDAPLAKEGATLPITSTLPDVNPDEILAGLDADTRDYLKLLVNGAGDGLEGRGDDLRAVLKRFEPTYRDIALVNGEVRKRRVELRRLVRSLNVLNAELADKDGDLSELVQVASRQLRNFAVERDSVEGLARELPGALAASKDALGRVGLYARTLEPAVDDLVPVARALRRTNLATRPFAEEAAPILRDRVRPFVRASRPTVRRLGPVADDLGDSTPTLTRTFKGLNSLFNLLAYNRDGAEGPDDPDRDEGFLFHLAWLGHQSVNLFSNSDAHGPLRSLTVVANCAAFQAVTALTPGAEQALGLSSALTDPRICGGTALPTAAEARKLSTRPGLPGVVGGQR
jgi:phospholipid/cholesterol/gamma-HCH transport system substrate-binding protein